MVHPYIKLHLSFLKTRVKCPDQQGWNKLRENMQYLVFTKDLLLTLEDLSVHVIKWFIDASFNMYHDMRCHTGGLMTLGKG